MLNLINLPILIAIFPPAVISLKPIRLEWFGTCFPRVNEIYLYTIQHYTNDWTIVGFTDYCTNTI